MRAGMLTGCHVPVERFFGVGARRAEAFHRLGISTARDLVYHFPRAYEPRGNVKTTRDAADGEVCSLILTVGTEPKTAAVRRGMVLTKVTAFDDFGKCENHLFQPALRQGQNDARRDLPVFWKGAAGGLFRFHELACL